MTKMKILITGVVTVFIFGFLFWEHFHGGVASHHILQQQNLPAISNWWNGLFLPVLTWFLLSRTEKRLGKQSSEVHQPNNLHGKVIKLFVTGLVLGVLIATSFTNGYSLFLDNVPYIILVLSLIIPIYYSEFILGFILGMTYTFGAILPTVFILVLAAIGIITYRFIRPLILKLIMKFTAKPDKSPNH
ncbi:hypothetical protein [Pontibacter vulgaris]|uniref:hypothetical protein n=1 Tax=Pontibacter vulgaris TaxID=2905679 RepID=UPI001FA7847A|nr:hypothetical protein [Pontibacter vulgaris]